MSNLTIEMKLEEAARKGHSLIFVYGTLLKGYGNHARLLNKEPICEATVNGYLVSLGGFPGLLALDSTEDVVTGELYDVSPMELIQLDRLEGYSGRDTPYNMYNRRPTTARVLNEPDSTITSITCETYVYNNVARDRSDVLRNRIANGSWREYTSARSWQQRLE